MKTLKIPPLKLHPDSMTMLSGGWKGYADQQISKMELYQLVEEMLGFSEKNCRDGWWLHRAFGPGILSAPITNSHIPIYSRLIVRDVGLRLATITRWGRRLCKFYYAPSVKCSRNFCFDGRSCLQASGAECGCGISAPFMKVLGVQEHQKPKVVPLLPANYWRIGEKTMWMYRGNCCNEDQLPELLAGLSPTRNADLALELLLRPIPGVGPVGNTFASRSALSNEGISKSRNVWRANSSRQSRPPLFWTSGH